MIKIYNRFEIPEEYLKSFEQFPEARYLIIDTKDYCGNMPLLFRAVCDGGFMPGIGRVTDISENLNKESILIIE